MGLLKLKSMLMRYEALIWTFMAKGTDVGFSQISVSSDMKYGGLQLERCSACVF